jgi:TRAP-type mannitol/chloroaromatic compound transport system permease small subunit
MALVTALIVVLRYALNEGTIVLQESVVYLHGCAFMLGIAYAFRHDRHVRVDLIYSKLNRRTQLCIDMIGNLVCLVPVCIFIVYFSASYVISSWEVLEGSPEVGGIPGIFLLKTLIPVMAATLLAQGLAEVARGILDLRDGAMGGEGNR